MKFCRIGSFKALNENVVCRLQSHSMHHVHATASCSGSSRVNCLVECHWSLFSFFSYPNATMCSLFSYFQELAAPNGLGHNLWHHQVVLFCEVLSFSSNWARRTFLFFKKKPWRKCAHRTPWTNVQLTGVTSSGVAICHPAKTRVCVRCTLGLYTVGSVDKSNLCQSMAKFVAACKNQENMIVWHKSVHCFLRTVNSEWNNEGWTIINAMFANF